MDIVERLRREYDAIGAALHADAADEIERLRNALELAQEYLEESWGHGSQDVLNFRDETLTAIKEALKEKK